MPWPFYPLERGMIPTLQEAGWSPQPACKGAENLTPHRDLILGLSIPLQVAHLSVLQYHGDEPSSKLYRKV